MKHSLILCIFDGIFIVSLTIGIRMYDREWEEDKRQRAERKRRDRKFTYKFYEYEVDYMKIISVSNLFQHIEISGERKLNVLTSSKQTQKNYI
ncbi:hypothetical protein YC2023_096487 [Brassica napus]